MQAYMETFTTITGMEFIARDFDLIEKANHVKHEQHTCRFRLWRKFYWMFLNSKEQETQLPCEPAEYETVGESQMDKSEMTFFNIV